MEQTSPTRDPARTKARRRASAVALWAVAACAGLSCGSPTASNGRPVTRQVVTSAGGQASVSGGRFKVQVPQDAVKQDVAITIQEIDVPAAGAIGPVYEVGPTGTVFQRAVTLTFSFANLSLDGVDVQALHVATLSGGQWVPVTSAVDLVSGVVTGQITHLSPWTLIAYTDVVPPPPDAGVGGAGGNGGAGGVGGAGGGAGAGMDGGSHDATAGAGGSAGTTDAGGGGHGGAGSSGSAGTSGSGSAGTSGSGSAGTSGSGSAGTSGSGSAGTGGSGSAGTSGSGSAGTSGTAGDSGQGGAAGQTAGTSGSDDAGTDVPAEAPTDPTDAT